MLHSHLDATLAMSDTTHGTILQYALLKIMNSILDISPRAEGEHDTSQLHGVESSPPSRCRRNRTRPRAEGSFEGEETAPRRNSLVD